MKHINLKKRFFSRKLARDLTNLIDEGLSIESIVDLLMEETLNLSRCAEASNDDEKGTMPQEFLYAFSRVCERHSVKT